MFKKLRRNFIIIAMSSVLAVLIIIIASLNAVNFSKVTANADFLINFIEVNDGTLPEKKNDSSQNIELPETITDGKKPVRNEMFYETRFFSAKVYSEDHVVVNTKYTISFTEEEATELAIQKANGTKTIGYKGDFRYKVFDKESYKLVIFLDCGVLRSQARNFLLVSISASFTGVVAFFILIVVFSKYVFNPVQKSYESQKRFISNASHQLKTPLTIISANNELLEIEHGKDECITEIDNQIKILTKMISNLSTLSKLDELDHITFEPITVSEILNEFINSYVNVFKDKNIKFSYDVDDSVIINGDSRLLEQLISVFFDNARKYAKSYFKMSLRSENKEQILEFRNDMFDDVVINEEKVFERFYRSNEDRANKEGSGIGLSIANEIIEKHHAKATCNVINKEFIITIIFN